MQNDGEVLIEDPDTDEVVSLLPDLEPWYRNFKGKITAQGQNKFITYGNIEKISRGVSEVTELPIGMWTNRFKEFAKI